MQIIETQPLENIILCGNQHGKAECVYEISSYGILIHDQKELLKNDQVGFLIRVKPKNQNEGGVLAGAGCLCSWMIEDDNKPCC